MRWLFLLALLPVPAAAEPLDVVASFSILADLVQEVGGDRVRVTTLVPPGGDVHVYAPTPQDAARVAEADLVIVNGLGFEGWMSRLLAAAGGEAHVVEASAMASKLVATAPHGHGHAGHGHEEGGTGATYDPHAFQDADNVRTYVSVIAQALSAADPDGQDAYVAGLRRYDDALARLDDELRAAFEPFRDDTVLIPHGAMNYFAMRYGIAIVSAQGFSTEAEPSAAQIGALIERAREGGVDAIFVEAQGDRRMVEAIAAESGMAVGPPLFIDTLSAPDGPAPDYLSMMRYNARMLTETLADAKR